jgi:hypothetical protein
MEAAAPEDLVHACSNIGPAERAKRVRIGYVWSGAALVGGAVLVAIHAPWPSRLLIGIPMLVGAMGFIQARAHRCVAFVSANIKVMGDCRRDRIAVTDDAERAAFRKKAWRLNFQGLAVTAVVVGLFLLLP